MSDFGERFGRAGWPVLALLALVWIWTACGESSSGEDSEAAADGDWRSWDGDVPDGDTAPGDNSEYPDGDDTGHEDEVEKRMSLPKIGKDFVFILNRDAGSLVMIDTDNLEIRTLPVGENPAVVETVPGDDVALVIDRATDKLVLALAAAGRSVAWPMGEERDTGYNAISVSPKGDFAMLYFNSQMSEDLWEEGLGSLQEVALVDLRHPGDLDELTRPIVAYTVGLNPTQVQWSSDGRKAFVVTDMGITAFDFEHPDSPALTPNIQLEAEWGDPVDREVKITPDGRYALVRRFDSNVLTLVDLDDHERLTLTLEHPPTDLDLTSDGSRALVVVRENARLASVPVPEGFSDVNRIDWVDIPENAGVLEIGPDDNTLLLYSTLTSDEIIWSHDLQSGTTRTFHLQKGVESVAFSPRTDNGLKVVIFNTKEPGVPSVGADLYEIIDKSYGYTLLNLESGVQVLQTTDADQADFTFTPDGGKAYILVTDEDAVREVQIADLTSATGARIKELELNSVPTGVGVIPGSDRVYVSQNHPDGRITFIDTDTDEPLTVTGFELNGNID